MKQRYLASLLLGMIALGVSAQTKFTVWRQFLADEHVVARD